MYLIITMGNNGENGAIHSMEKTLAFWNLYGEKYKDETHVIYEAHNEPVTGINGNWTSDDWAKQAQMYETIRGVAPDTINIPPYGRIKVGSVGLADLTGPK